MKLRIHPGGYAIIVAAAVLALFLALLWGWLLLPGLALVAGCVYFFRDPERVTPLREGLIVSPADGAVICIDEMAPPEELGIGSEPMRRIGIFLNVNDVHVNRVPADGRVVAVESRSGGFAKAFLPEAATHNQRRSMLMETADGARLIVVQMTGYVARRIVCYAEPGQELRAGARYGLIRFGSRVDVYMPQDAVPMVGIGQRTVAGETVLADRQGTPDGRDYATR